MIEVKLGRARSVRNVDSPVATKSVENTLDTVMMIAVNSISIVEFQEILRGRVHPSVHS